MTDFITKKGYHTLEDVAIEVGVRKLGYVGPILDLPGQTRCLNAGITWNIGATNYTKEQIIAAAFPFEAKCNDGNGCRWCPTLVNEMSKYTDILLDNDEWQLTNPYIASKTNPIAGPLSKVKAAEEDAAEIAICEDASQITKQSCTCGAIKCGSPFHSAWCDGK